MWKSKIDNRKYNNPLRLNPEWLLIDQSQFMLGIELPSPGVAQNISNKQLCRYFVLFPVFNHLVLSASYCMMHFHVVLMRLFLTLWVPAHSIRIHFHRNHLTQPGFYSSTDNYSWTLPTCNFKDKVRFFICLFGANDRKGQQKRYCIMLRPPSLYQEVSCKSVSQSHLQAIPRFAFCKPIVQHSEKKLCKTLPFSYLLSLSIL